VRKLYLFLILCCCLSWLPTQAQNWRPFRLNGDVHAFRGASADTVLTLRLDSAGVSGYDSVYFFNRTVQRINSFAWQKSRNNQFGKLMRYNAPQRTYTLYWQDDPSPLLLDRSLVLKPFVPVGTTWSSAFTDYGVTTTLLSRGTSLIDGVMDSVVTFQVRTGAIIVLSKNFGLVSGPANLLFGVPTPKILTLTRRPAPAGLSYYNPLTLLDLQPGDELGYNYQQFTFNPIGCATGTILRRVLTRQLTTDSLVYTFQEQSRTVYNGAPGCVSAGTVVSPIYMVRFAASRSTGQWRGLGLLIPLSSPLLAYGYEPLGAGASGILMGYPVVSSRPGGACGGPATLLLEALFRSTGTGAVYGPGLDALNQQLFSAPGVGAVRQPEHELVYTRRTINGTVQTCGSRTNFGTLLPTKAAQRASAFQLYPNPATASATLKLPESARSKVVVRLLDSVGRVVQEQQLAAGQTTTTVSLQGLVPGVYVVQLQAPGETTQHLRLQHQ
jgi:hypothetical protein